MTSSLEHETSIVPPFGLSSARGSVPSRWTDVRGTIRDDLVFLPRNESKIVALARTSGEKLLLVMITNWCHAARCVFPEVRTAAQSRTRGKCGGFG